MTLWSEGTFGISPSFLGLSQSSGHVTHVLLTRSRLCPGPKPGSSLHLHVLGTPPAFVLSQDQTLREELHKELSGIPLAVSTPRTVPRDLTSKTWVPSWWKGPSPPRPTVRRPLGAPSTQEELRETRRVQSWRCRSIDSTSEPADDSVEPGHTLGHRQAEVRMLLSFQRPSPPGGRGFLPGDAPRPFGARGRRV